MVKDITNEWTKICRNAGAVKKQSAYTVDGIIYSVDGKYVVLKPSVREWEVAKLLAEKYHKIVELIPKINYPPGIQTPDYLIDGERFDLKSPTGKGKSVLRDMVKRKARQAPNFLFDLTDCPLAGEEIERQIRGIYGARRTNFVEKIVLMRNGKIEKVYNK